MTGGVVETRKIEIVLPRAVRWTYVLSGILSLVCWWLAVAAARIVIASLLWGVAWACFGIAVGAVDFTVLGRKMFQRPSR